ncbi:sensor histidine kinase [Nocardia tengchongensis]|uniref:sensor histidine kinase n=1 Tax=Nocardia tengchongensis TaxID=2055889 RepID=UPI0036C5FA77
MNKIPRAFRISPNVRFRVLSIALIPSLTLLIVGGVTADHSLRDARTIRNWSGAIGKTAGPALDFVEAVQQERHSSMLVLSGDTAAAAGLQPERARLDAAVPRMMAAGDDLIKLFHGEIGDAVTQMQATFGQLPIIRQRIDLGAAQIDEVYDYYNKVIQTVIIAGRLAARTATVPEAANEQDTEVGLFVTAEAMSRSSSLAAAASFKGGFTAAQQEEYSKLVGYYRIELDNRAGQLPPGEMAVYTALVSSPQWRQMGILEKSLLQRAATVSSTEPGSSPGTAPGGMPGTATPSAAPPPTGPSTTPGPSPSAPAANGSTVSGGTTESSANTTGGTAPSATAPVPALAGWTDAAGKVSADLRGIWNSHLRYAGEVAQREGDRLAHKSVVGGVTALSLSMVAFAAAVLLSQRLIGRLRRLRSETLTVSETRLPAILEQLRQAETVDLDQDMPRLEFGRDEIGQVADAFNQAQKAATTAAVNEARTRHGVQAVFVNIARRSQATMHQLLELLNQAEHRHDDPDTLKMLFEFDNLATRERRNAENLVILGGERPGRQWRNPVSLQDVVRSAVTETEHYSRVHTVRLPEVPVIGAVVADLIHLLAELIDNAATFSPPRTRVEISGEMGGAGLIIEISDLGIGLDRSDLTRINEMLSTPPDFNISTLSTDSRLGLFVVGQLAKRHRIAVRLTESDYGGIRSVVRLPYELVVVGDLGEQGSPELVTRNAELRKGAHRTAEEAQPAALVPANASERRTVLGDSSTESEPSGAAAPSAGAEPVRAVESRGAGTVARPESVGTAGSFSDIAPSRAVEDGPFRNWPTSEPWGGGPEVARYEPADDGPALPQRRRQTPMAAPPVPTRMPDDHPSMRIQRDRLSGQGRPADLWTALQAGTKLGRAGVPVGSPGDPMSDNERQWND